MNKRYQIFVSSTYVDLKEERERVIYELTKTGLIAVGMEQFRATDEEQMEYIRPQIDDTDYYILIIKGRYGSLAPDGLSYTHKEYLYARKKGIPVHAFLYKDINNLKFGEMDNSVDLIDKLNKFRDELSSQRIVDFWETTDDLVWKVKDSINSSIRRRPGIGWIRGDQAMDLNVYKELEAARKTIDQLRNQVTQSENAAVSFPKDTSSGADLYNIRCVSFLNGREYENFSFSMSWDEIFMFFIEHIYIEKPEDNIMGLLSQHIINKKYGNSQDISTNQASLRLEEFTQIRTQLEFLGLIEAITKDTGIGKRLHWRLTDKGRKYIGQLTAIRRNSAESPTPPAPRP
ncbi:DUF4062 domain-containing protein [Methylocystis heyeri]|uniref:DUF4062 domain-containing protein n=1 Tax=Methylocystis heyeri TaxID=391905 RepID=A0A6B8KBK8_9HYPH|nr:DUF4062 domain-containing protein [Methylocystis heyeri]QGM45546.1 DUF4062 domain-containing protein [Methylocystis heyeri]